jgi:hypothetical protein
MAALEIGLLDYDKVDATTVDQFSGE